MATTINGSTGVSQIQDDTVTTAKVDDSQITNALMADDAIGIAELSATGTASSSTFLRGDNAWAAPTGGGMTLLKTINTTSGTSHTTGTINLTGYKQLIMVCYSIGSSAATGGQFRYTPNGGSALILYPTPTGSSTQAQYTMYTHDLGSGIARSNSL
jgi:hypothetical protein